MTPDDVLDWERRHGALPDRSAVFALTGWGTRAPDEEAYLNTDASGVMHTPGFGVEATDGHIGKIDAPARATIIVGVPRYEAGSGGPARVLALA